MLVNHLAHETHDRRIIRGKGFHALLFVNSANGFHGDAGLLRVIHVRRPLMLAVELARTPTRRIRAAYDPVSIRSVHSSPDAWYAAPSRGCTEAPAKVLPPRRGSARWRHRFFDLPESNLLSCR